MVSLVTMALNSVNHRAHMMALMTIKMVMCTLKCTRLSATLSICAVSSAEMFFVESSSMMYVLIM